jgi:hypothetical protein
LEQVGQMGAVVRNPYRNNGRAWLRGNLHAHTGNSDGPHSPQGVIDAYAARGYDFLMLSDHDCLTDPAPLDPQGMTLIPGNEISANGPHILHVAAQRTLAPDENRQAVIDAIEAEGGLSILCHPNWEAHFNHCPQEKLMEWQRYAGIEVFNGVVTWLEGSPMATDRWDQLLGHGRRVWGFAHDDCHKSSDIGVAWNVVQSERRDAASILDALRHGRFYASTGVTIESIQVHGNTVTVSAPGAHRISVFSDFGRRPAVEDGPAITYTIPDDAAGKYVRFECAGCGEQRAWTQPFFIA